MTYEERKKRRLIKKRLRGIIVIVFLVYLIIRSIPIALAKNAKTILPEQDILIKSIETQGILIKSEKVYTTVGGIDGNAQKLEGKRVPVGYKVANVSLLRDVSGLKEELKEIEDTINILSKSDKELELFEKDKMKVQESQENLVKTLQEKINNSDYSSIREIKEGLEQSSDKIADLSPSTTLIGQSLDSLNKRKEDILEEINSNTVMYTTSTAGILSFKVDGYENLYIPKDFENYTYENLDIPKELKRKEENDFTGFKIIDNFQWYMGLKIDDIKNLKEYEVGDFLHIRIKDDDRELTGRIVAINKSGNKMVVILRFNAYLEDYFDLRFPSVDIILSEKKGFKIPTKSILDKEGQKGVYIKEFNGIVKFRPISIIDSNKDYTFVNIGKNGYIDIKGYEKPVQTINLYDEIFLNPSIIEEGQILD